MLHKIPFYDGLSIERISQAFRKFARSFEIEITNSKHPLVELEASKSIIKDLFKDLLNETNGFNY